MAVLYRNNAASSLASGINTTATSIVLVSGGGAKFPAPTGSDFFYLTILDGSGNNEIVRVNTRTTDTLTVVRAQEGTTALSFSAGVLCELRITGGLLDQFKTDTASGITSSNVTNALGFTPYNASNPSGYITGITSSNVTTALGFTPYNATNPSGFISGITSGMVTTALGYTPYNSSNPSGYITGITSGMVTTALGFTPYNNSNPSGYITSAALSPYLTTASAASTYLALSGDATRSGTTTLSGVTIFNNYISLNGDFYHNGNQYILNPAQDGWINIVNRNGGSPFINNVTYAGNTILHAGNYTSYAPAISYSRFTGDINTLGVSNATSGIYNIGAGYTNGPGSTTLYGTLQAYWNGDIAVQFWHSYNGDSYWRKSIGGTFSGAAWRTNLDSSNYNSYSPTLTGGGASGTWGINVTGTAGSISGFNNPTTAATANTIAYRDSGGDIYQRYSFAVHFNQSGGNSENPTIGQIWTNSTSDNYVRKSTPAHFISQLGLLTTSNYSSYALPLSGGTVSGTVRINSQLQVGQNTNGTAIIDAFSGIARFGRDSTAYGLQIDGSHFASFVTGNGSLQLGALNTSYSHFQTDRPQFYFNKTIYVDGSLYQYGTSYLYLNSGNYSSYALPLGGGTMTGSLVNNQDGGVIIESNASEYNNWLWKENAKQWGIFWFNKGSQSGQTIGTYTTIGAEAFFMGGVSSGPAMPTDWTGYQSGSYISAMISNYTGYIYSASTVYAASSMLVGGSTVLHASNYSSYALPLSGGTLSGDLRVNTIRDTGGVWVVGKYGSEVSLGSAGAVNDIRFNSSSNAAFEYRGNSILHAGNYTNYVQLPYAGWDSYPGKDANTVVGGSWMRSYFTYSNNAPLTGALVHFPAGGYDLQLNGSYGDSAGRLAFRNRNGDNATFLPWREILHANNYTSYSPSLTGSGASGTWGISISGSAASATTASQLGGVDASNYFRVDGTYPNDDMNTPVEGYWHVRSYAAGLPEGYYGHRWDYDHLNNAQWVAQMYSPTSGDAGLWFRQRRDFSWQTWRKFLDSSNYSSYALPLSGGTLSGGLTVNNATINVPSGYVSNGNPWGTSNSAFFPNGITTNNVTSWIYGNLYLGNAPSNGSGAEISSNGRFYNSTSSGTAMHVRRTGSGGSATNAYTALFEQTWGDHSWGIVAEFRAGGSGGSDRPSILFSNGYNSTTWSVGFGAADDQFRINQNHGHRNGGWGSERFRIDTGSTAYFNGNVAIHAANVSSYALPIGGGTLTSSTKIKAGHGDTRFQLHYNHDNADTTSGYAGYLTLWASEPGLSYAYTGIGGNINIGGNYYGRQTSGQAYGLYLRFETASGFSEFWATTGAVGSAGGQGSRVAYIDAAGTGTFSGNVTAYSDERLKKDWAVLPADFIARLATVKSGTYTRVDSGARQAGSSAQDWKTLLPEVVSASNDEAQTLSLAYGNAALVSAVELAKDNVELRARIERLETLINKLIGD